jgi:hypothetical protein
MLRIMKPTDSSAQNAVTGRTLLIDRSAIAAESAFLRMLLAVRPENVISVYSLEKLRSINATFTTVAGR